MPLGPASLWLLCNPTRGIVTALSVAAGDAGTLEARVRLDAGSGLRAGATGEARVLWSQATVLTAVTWAVRGWIRSHVLL